ncbi:Type 1 glutamine amidotransferase-like domain-containing protein [Gryllotalpicola reticulitermitis]|uniref:Type 1 glutamine amidotransferase-like domain-containing protein n=1 Tax=Gryllotalpicola reticulitermitis TaxID=1184153 RepID=A0ABV8Q991_9MICO
MRLYLSSYQLGDRPDLFASLVTGDRRGWVVMNALDGLDETRRQADVSVQIANLGALGLRAEDLDLRNYDPATLSERFGAPDFVWIRGGNVFTLRAAMARSGLDAIVTERLRQDTMVYAGFSAGACVLAPSLAGLELCDPTDVCAATYGTVRYDGLGILDRPVVPHLHSPGHPETEILGDVAAQYASARQPFWPLRDGQALVVNGSSVAVV